MTEESDIREVTLDRDGLERLEAVVAEGFARMNQLIAEGFANMSREMAGIVRQLVEVNNRLDRIANAADTATMWNAEQNLRREERDLAREEGEGQQ